MAIVTVDGMQPIFGGLTAQVGWLGLHSSNKPGELSQ